MRLKCRTAYFRWLQKYYLNHDPNDFGILYKILSRDFQRLEKAFDVWVKHQYIMTYLGIEPYDIAARTLYASFGQRACIR